MMKLVIHKNNINLLERLQLNISAIEYYKNFTDNDDVFIKKFINNIHNLPNLNSFYVSICGTNSYYHDLTKYEQLFFCLITTLLKILE